MHSWDRGQAEAKTVYPPRKTEHFLETTQTDSDKLIQEIGDLQRKMVASFFAGTIQKKNANYWTWTFFWKKQQHSFECLFWIVIMYIWIIFESKPIEQTETKQLHTRLKMKLHLIQLKNSSASVQVYNSKTSFSSQSVSNFNHGQFLCSISKFSSQPFRHSVCLNVFQTLTASEHKPCSNRKPALASLS